MRQFVRQLQNQPGVQLNPIKDRTDSGVLGDFDRTAALVGRFTRGRIDKPFRVNLNTMPTLLGKPASIALSALNEAYAQGNEALQNGARELVVARLSVAAAAVSWVTFLSGTTSTFAVSSSAPTTGTFGVKHLGCHNDGIIVKVHAEAKTVSGSAVASDMVTVQITDADGLLLHSITGSLTAGSTDEFGNSNYLPEVSARQTDMLEWVVIAGATIGTTHDGYGKAANSLDKYATSSVQVAFSEGGTGYLSTDYDNVVASLRNCQEDFGYIMGGGTRAVSLITKLADLGYDTNRQFVFDVPGELSVLGAIAFMQSLGFGTLGKDHYPQAYWAPLKSTDPATKTNVVFGTSGAQVGFRCARNANTNGYGLAPKHTPIAGLNGPLGRTGVQQILALTDQDLSDLAAAKINPVIFQTFTTTAGFFYSDALTCAATKLSHRKLISVAEMSSFVDEMVVRKARECALLPMTKAIRDMEDFLEAFFNGCKASEWLVEPADADKPPYAFSVAQVTEAGGTESPDRMAVEYRLHYNGLNRQTVIQQILV
jgi:hypothetical protein